MDLDEDSVIAGAQSSVVSVSVSRWTWMKTVSLLVLSHHPSVECIAVDLDEDSVTAGAQSSVVSVSVSRWT